MLEQLHQIMNDLAMTFQSLWQKILFMYTQRIMVLMHVVLEYLIVLDLEYQNMTLEYFQELQA